MRNFLPLSWLALAAAFSVAGCRSNAPTENVAPDANQAMAAATPTQMPTLSPTPAASQTGASKTGEDERYRATNADDQGFGEGATPDMIANFKAAMAKAHQQCPPLALKVPDMVKVVMTTNRGPITLELNAKEAPLAVKSFVYLAQKGFYDGTTFHRHADLLGNGKGYIIQGGDPLTKYASAVGFAGLGGPGYEVPREHNKLTHQKLVIAAARTQDPDSAGSQFYITQDAVPFLDEGDGYTVFGKVTGGAAAALKLTQGDTLQSVKVETPIAQPKG